VGFFVCGMMVRFSFMIAMIKSLFNWIVGILFLLVGLVNLFSMEDSSKEDFIVILIIALIGLYFLPPVRIRLKSIFGSKNQTNTMLDEESPDKRCPACNNVVDKIVDCEECDLKSCDNCWEDALETMVHPLPENIWDTLDEYNWFECGCCVCIKNKYFSPVIELLNANNKKYSISDIAALIRQDREQVKKILEWMYELKVIDFAGNGRYYIYRESNEAQSSVSEPSSKNVDVESELESLKSMLDKGLINQEDYDAKKKELLGL